MLKIVHVNSTDTSPFHAQLHQFAADNHSKLHLKIHKILGVDELSQLREFIESQKPFPFTKLSLQVDLTTLKSPHFLANLDRLNSTSVSGVELIFSDEDVQNDNQAIIDALTTTVAPMVFYPLQVRELGKQGVVPSRLELNNFQKVVIANIQKRNKEQYDVAVPDGAVISQRRTLDPIDPLAKKIRLKEIIKRKSVQDEVLAHYIPLEVQHVEIVEQDIVQQQEVVEVQIHLEQHDIHEYAGQLIGFQEFTAPIYKNKVKEITGDETVTESLYALLKQELFANLPHAIKYISPEAAQQLALNLPGLVTLNKDNIPNGFVLKQTQLGELVLDYDVYFENEHSNPFTPVESDIELEPIYTIQLTEQDVKRWIGDEQLHEMLCPSHRPYVTPKQLTNLWVKQGDEGVSLFFNEFKKAVESQPGLTSFLMEHYLAHLPQWDHLYNNKPFFACLERISHYDEQKLNCLTSFLKNTGSSRHDLSKTVAAFEVFWSELNLLCTEQKVSISGINKASWSTLNGGNPVVYMERLLFILKNARSLDDQFKLFSGISLDNYGAYYASRFEGFKAVSSEMALHYDAEEQNKLPFNKHFNLYRVELDSLSGVFAQSKSYMDLIRFASHDNDDYDGDSSFWLINCANALPQPLNLEQLKNDGLAIPFNKKAFVSPYQFYYRNEDGHLELLYAEKPNTLTKAEYYASSFRFIGIQTSGITVSSFSEQFALLKSRYMDHMNLSGELLGSLFFISHGRYIEDQALDLLFQTLNHATIHQEVIINAIHLLTKLYKLDIKLNQAEGFMLFQSISGMNSAEFEGLNLSKEDCITKLLTQLERNKFATFKLFDVRTKRFNPKWPFLYALDTAEFLAKDPMIQATYHDDLLLFSGLINSERNEVYYHDRYADEQQKKTSTGQRVLGNLEKVQYFLHQAATLAKPSNLHYAIQVIINAKESFTYGQFIKVCTNIESLHSFDSKTVDDLLRHHNFTVSAELPEIFTKDNADLKSIMISLMMQLEAVKKKSQPNQSESIEQNAQELHRVGEELDPQLSSIHSELSHLSIAELKPKLQLAWQEAGVLLSIVGKIYLAKILKTTKEMVIKSAFNMPDAEGLLKVIAEKIGYLPDFQNDDDFEKINHISSQAENIAKLFKQILKNPFVLAHEQEFITLFKQVDFTRFDYETLYAVLFLLTSMPQRNYLSLLHTFFADARFIDNKERVVELVTLLSILNNSYFPSEYLDAFSKLVIANPGENEFNVLLNRMITVFDKDNNDPVLTLIMTHPELTYKQVIHLLNMSEEVDNNRQKISDFLIHLIHTKKLESFLKQISGATPDAQKKIIEILSKGHALNRIGAMNNDAVKYNDLSSLLAGLSFEELELLYTFYESTPVSAASLFHALQKPDRTRNFEHFLLEFEKAPFGERDLKKQFSRTEVERVINQSKDLINNSEYPYQYRKQLMESFLFVNEIGENLPVYYNKPAKELTNAEIKSFFADLKSKKMAGLTPFQSRLLALGLMRETMYRSTGEFPYSTQMIALINGMMHQGDLIENIDTGQGKSLIDAMKAALLWLDSDRVDLTTSSLVDAKRDIANYGSFLKLLGIPYSPMPISSTSSNAVFQKDGINFSTFSQLSLFFAKAKVMGDVLDTADTVVSLVANESDHTILDDRIIYRFATADGAGVSYGQEWIYYALNEFVSRPEFIDNGKSIAGEDIDELKAYLKVKARELKKSGKIINKFSDAQYLSWLESALMVNYVLKENEDYVIPDEFEKKIMNGVELRSKVVKVLMKDDKVSPDSIFGNGIQQLLYARLNKERESADFVIEPQNKTIISSNNKNLIDYYRARKGYIWGSSGSVGSSAEVQEQYTKYGFEFSKAEPHQENKVKWNKPIIEVDERAHFKRLIRQLTAETLSVNSAPSLVFCKDINTAIRLFKELEKQNPKKFPLQLYTGLGKEEEYIHNASKPGMITITTSALGRNTDIHYDKMAGLRVWHTFIDSTRGSRQKSGRTGRQGSAGEVNYLLNAQELGDKSIEDIRIEIEQRAALERSVNEELYTILGYLLTQMDTLRDEQFNKGKAAFLREAWAPFSTDTEAQFRESRFDVAFDKDIFIQKTLASFNQIIGAAVKMPVPEITPVALCEAIKQQHPKKAMYRPYTKGVKLEDCIPPVTIAYHLLHVEAEEKSPERIQATIKAKLTQLFKGLTKDTFVTKNRDYLHYLNSNPSTQEVIVKAHKEFLTQFLKEHSQKLNIVQRWLGFEGTLNQIASNSSYLLMFHAFASMPNQPVIDLEVIKQSVNRLLDEYLETSWFVSAERRQWALDLKVSIHGAQDVDTLIRYLSQAQVEVAKQDIATNKGRILKPLHLFGHSRFQSTVSRALNLAASLSAKTNVDVLTDGLTPLLTDVTDNTPVTDLTLDELKHRAQSPQNDRNNASVINNALENALTITNRQEPVGMIGRKGFFSMSQEDKTTHDEISPAPDLIK